MRLNNTAQLAAMSKLFAAQEAYKIINEDWNEVRAARRIDRAAGRSDHTTMYDIDRTNLALTKAEHRLLMANYVNDAVCNLYY